MVGAVQSILSSVTTRFSWTKKSIIVSSSATASLLFEDRYRHETEACRPADIRKSGTFDRMTTGTKPYRAPGSLLSAKYWAIFSRTEICLSSRLSSVLNRWKNLSGSISS